jgi:hypothetical protein
MRKGTGTYYPPNTNHATLWQRKMHSIEDKEGDPHTWD